MHAFQDPIAQLVSESDLQLAAWRRKIVAAVGVNGQVLIEVIPELERVIGSQPAVAELSGTAAQLQKLPLATQHVLKLAACIGDRFDLETLAIVSERSQLSVVTVLWQGLQAGSILVGTQIYKFWQAETTPLPLAPIPSWKGTEIWAGSGFRFLHDRVQQAAYSLIPESQKQQTHLQIGRLLLANTPPAQQEAKLFEIVNHFNTAIDLIQTRSERAMLAQLNLQAAQKARAAIADAAAFSYARIGTQLLDEADWQQQYHLNLALHETAAETALLMGDLELVQNWYKWCWSAP